MHDMWRMDTYDGIKGVLTGIVKAVVLSIRFFIKDRVMERASALTYYTMLAIVPIVALLIGIASGFISNDELKMMLLHYLPAQQQVIDYVFGFASNYLEHNKTGIVMGIGIVMLLYVVVNLIDNIETVFNNIWQQSHGRSLARKITDYLSVIILVPLFLFVSSGMEVYLQTYLKTAVFDTELGNTMLRVLKWTPFVLTIMMFTMMYIVIPNTKVHFRNALIAGVIAGSAFIGFQQIYITGQIWVSNYNAIYGSFAALPLFMLWVRTSWVIVLYGAALSYSCQNISFYDFESDDKHISRLYRDFLCMLVAGVVYKRFSNGEQAPTTVDIYKDMQLPYRIAGQVIDCLSDHGIICATVPVIAGSLDDDTPRWVPGRDISKYSLTDLKAELETSGITDFNIKYTEKYRKQWQLLQTINNDAIRKGQDFLVKDI